MNEIIVRKIDNVYFKIECDFSQALELKEYLSCYAVNFQYHPKFKNRLWNGKVYFFSNKDYLLPIGLLPNLFRFSKKFDYKIKLDLDINSLSNQYSDELIEKFCDQIKEDYKTKYELYDYQQEALIKCIKNKRGIAQIATGGGKSLIQFYLMQFLRSKNKKIMMIVPTVSLVNQMYSDFMDYGWYDIDEYVEKLYSGEKPIYNKDVLITTWQSIYTRPQSFFEQYTAIIVDEVHNAKSLSINSIMKKCINADYKYGFTGTMPKEQSDVYNIIGYIGPVLYEQISKNLIDKGVLSQIAIANLLLKYPSDMVERNKNRIYNEEVNTICTYSERNKVFEYLFKHMEDKQNSIILCHLIDHLKLIESYLKNHLDSKYTIYIIYGDIKPSERELIRKTMNEKSNVILLGTYSCLSTGLNINKLHNVIFASSYKSRIKVLQSIGRGLRLHESKSKMILYDLVDDMTWTTRTGSIGKNHIYKHWEERLKYYDEQGFKYMTREFKL